MDFKLFLAVVKRYKRMVISGTVLAIVLVRTFLRHARSKGRQAHDCSPGHGGLAG